MKSRTFVLQGSISKRALLKAIDEAPMDGTVDVTLQVHKDHRTLAQNRLLWLWHTEFGREHGIDKTEAHLQFKWRFIRPILIRDDPDWAELFSTASESPGAARKLSELIHTPDVDIEQMSEALEAYDYWCGTNGIRLTHPENLSRQAFGL